MPAHNATEATADHEESLLQTMVKRSLNAPLQLMVAMYTRYPPKDRRSYGNIESFRKGERDNVAVWLGKGRSSILCKLYAGARPKTIITSGTLELVQDM